MERVRRIVTRSGGGYRGKFPSRKLMRAVHYQSLLERDAILHLEYHPSVLAYQEQPCVVTYYDAEQNPRSYYPDFQAILVTGEDLFIEVKPAEKLERGRTKAKLERVAVRFDELKQRYRVWTQREIRRAPLIQNLKSLHAANRPVGKSAVPHHVIAGLRDEAASFELSELVGRIGSEAGVHRLIAAGVFQANLELPMTATTRVWTRWSKENQDDPFSL